jgi:hypothetical protein
MKELDQRLEARIEQVIAGSRPLQRPSGQSPLHGSVRVSEKVK